MAGAASAAEGIHLVNCDFLVPGSSGTPPSSAVIYCPDDSNCNTRSSCFTGDHNHRWEGSTQSCTFTPSGVTFSWGIAADAQSKPNFSPVGGGNNGRQFTCYKDDQHALFTQNGVTCRSIYYCL